MQNITILKTLQILENKISDRMDEFHNLGKLAKQQISQNSSEQDIKETYMKMGAILTELEPVDFIVRKQYVYMVGLFDALLTMYNEELANHKLIGSSKNQKGSNDDYCRVLRMCHISII